MKNTSVKTMKKGEKGFFAFADFYGGGGQALIGVLYFFFLTNVIGLAPALAGVVTLISEIWDAISDPLMGVIGDNTKTKMGRRRPCRRMPSCGSVCARLSSRHRIEPDLEIRLLRGYVSAL